MSRRPGLHIALLVALVLAGSASLARAQDIQMQTLAAPDAFSTPGRDTGLPPTLWGGVSPKLAETVVPLLASKTLSPAGAALARRVLATGAQGPKGVDDITAARAEALMAQGDPKAAAAILSRAPGIDRNPELARAGAESALLAGDDARACAVAQGLGAGREQVYWLRLRAYCQAINGHPDQAQLTFDLAQAQAKDAVFGRLMSAKISGVGNPGAASARNGLDLALSRSLGLDLAAAKPSPEVAAAAAGGEPAPPRFDRDSFAPDLAPAVDALLAGKPISYSDFGATLGGVLNTSKTSARTAAVELLIFGVTQFKGEDFAGADLGSPLPEGRAPVGRNIALDSSANAKLVGQVALLALWTCAEAGPAGPAMGDRIRIVWALHAVGLDRDARNFALEGLLALK